MSKKWKYHTSHSFTDGERKVTMYSQLYEFCGVYVCIEGIGDRIQGGYLPAQLVKMEKHLIKQEKEGKITNLEFGREIIVTEIDGRYKEID